jgi:WD40 repeat protein
LLAAGKDFGRVVVWDVANKKFLCGVETGQGIVHAVAISPDGQTLATAGEGDNFKLKLWHLPDGKLTRTYDSSAGFIHSVAFGPTGEWIVFAENTGPTRVLDLATGKVLLELKETSFPVLSTDGTVLMTANKTEFIIWKTSDWSKLRSLPRSPAYAVLLAVHPETDKFGYSYAGAFALARLSTGELLPSISPRRCQNSICPQEDLQRLIPVHLNWCSAIATLDCGRGTPRVARLARPRCCTARVVSLAQTVHYSPVRKTTRYLPKASHPMESFFGTRSDWFKAVVLSPSRRPRKPPLRARFV